MDRCVLRPPHVPSEPRYPHSCTRSFLHKKFLVLTHHSNTCMIFSRGLRCALRSGEAYQRCAPDHTWLCLQNSSPLQGYLAHKKPPPPKDPTVGTSLGPYGGPLGGVARPTILGKYFADFVIHVRNHHGAKGLRVDGGGWRVDA